MFMFTFDQKTVQDVARHVRHMLKGIKRRPKNVYELATALAAAKIVVRTLELAAAEAQIDDQVLVACEHMADDLDTVMDLVRRS